MKEEICINCGLNNSGCNGMLCWMGIVHPYSKRAGCDCFGNMKIEEIKFFELKCICVGENNDR